MQQTDIVKRSAVPMRPLKNMQDFVRHWLSGRRGLIVGGLVVVIAGLALGWNWLSAIGAAPIILSLAPCAVMCAVGACAMRKGNNSCSQSGASQAAKPGKLPAGPARSEN